MTKFLALFAWDLSWEDAVDWSHNLLCLPSFPEICGPLLWLSFCWADSLPSLQLKATLLWIFRPLKPFTELTQLPMVSSYAFFMRIYLDFLVLYKALSKQSREHVSSENARAWVGHFTLMGPAVPLFVVWLLSVVELLQFFSWLVKALSVLSGRLHASSSAKLPKEWPRKCIQACTECLWQVLAQRKISLLAQSEPKPYTCGCARVSVCRDEAEGACWPWQAGPEWSRQQPCAVLHSVPLWFMLSVRSFGWIVAFAVIL